MCSGLWLVRSVHLVLHETERRMASGLWLVVSAMIREPVFTQLGCAWYRYWSIVLEYVMDGK